MSTETEWYRHAEERKGEAAVPTGTAANILSVTEERMPLLRSHGWYFLLLSAIAGVCHAALFTKADPAGINACIWGAVWSGILLSALRRLGREKQGRDRFCAASMLLLGLSAAWTDNGFLQLVSLFGMILLTFLWLLFAFCRTETWHILRYALGCFGLLFRGLGRLLEPFRHLLSLRRRKSGMGRHILLGLVIAVPLAAMALWLLSSADEAFRRLITVRWDAPKLLKTAFSACLSFLLAALGFYCLFSVQTEEPISSEERTEKKGSTVTAITFASVLAVIYLVFSVIQLGYLIPENGQVLTRGYTYANFAREGFFQLLVVSAMNVAVVLCAGRYFASSGALRWILAVICLCTYGMIASALVRMLLYVHFYGFTFSRLLVLWFLLLTVLLLTGTLIFVFRPDFPLFRVAFVGCMVLYLAFVFARPDALAARYDVRRFGSDSKVVLELIAYRELSLDAIPEVAQQGLFENEPAGDERKLRWNHIMTHEIPEKQEEADWREFNFSLHRAYKATEGLRNGQ